MKSQPISRSCSDGGRPEAIYKINRNIHNQQGDVEVKKHIACSRSRPSVYFPMHNLCSLITTKLHAMFSSIIPPPCLLQEGWKVARVPQHLIIHHMHVLRAQHPIPQHRDRNHNVDRAALLLLLAQRMMLFRVSWHQSYCEGFHIPEPWNLRQRPLPTLSAPQNSRTSRHISLSSWQLMGNILRHNQN